MPGSLLHGDEKVGVERLIECLQCCMWSSMIKKTPKNNGLQEFIKQEPNQAPLLSNLLITTTTTKTTALTEEKIETKISETKTSVDGVTEVVKEEIKV